MKEQIIEELRASLAGRLDVDELISSRAYEIYQSRGGEHGRDLDDWLQAEREVLGSLTQETHVGSTRVGQLAAGVDRATKRETEPPAAKGFRRSKTRS